MKNQVKKTMLILLFSAIGIMSVYGQKCRVAYDNKYDVYSDTDFDKLIGDLIFNDGAKSILTGFQDVIGLYAGKTSDGEIVVYLQHTRIIDNDNSHVRENISIAKGNELVIRGDFGKISLTAKDDFSASTDTKGLTRQTKNISTALYDISKEELKQLCSGTISTLIINYKTAPKLIKQIKEKKAKKHLKSWSCAPDKFM